MAITNKPGFSKGSMIVTPEHFLNLSEGLEGKPNVSEFPGYREFNDILEAITPAGFVSSFWCNNRRGNEAGS